MDSFPRTPPGDDSFGTRTTLSANAFFVDLAAAAMQVTSRVGGDDALVEWRSAAACARGRFRPDGYGCYRRGPWRFGFFLEYDRGTERSGHYAAKLATYYRYRDSGAYARDYQSFPTLLVVTTSAAAEARFAYQAYLAQEHHDAAPLTIFLTTTSHIAACPDDVLGRIWRSAAAPWADEPARVCWLPSLRRLGWTLAEPGLRVTDRRVARQSLETERVFGQTAVVSQQQSRGRSLTPS